MAKSRPTGSGKFKPLPIAARTNKPPVGQVDPLGEEVHGAVAQAAIHAAGMEAARCQKGALDTAVHAIKALEIWRDVVRVGARGGEAAPVVFQPRIANDAEVRIVAQGGAVQTRSAAEV